ncbi:MAG: SRPBCC family protein [Prolixibacteraceae bacterium]|nr:SRPBCC family protein [Prolixibacteraceae bacterium]
MSENTVKLHRVLTAPPEKVFRAFSNADAFSAWLPPYGFICKVHQMEFREKGTYKMSFTNFSTGNGHSFGGEFLEIRPGELLKYTDRFDDPNLPGEMVTTVRLTQVSCGTELHIVQEGIPDAIPVEMCYLGWQESLEKLKKLVEPEIPDA